ncbi:hypothetical protein [Streptomyces sp. NPDC056682]|uniref:hypothetical protein n=1 Tax=Streptomyces sp. NPDC056682 TaxID=3345909 RepID=UPI0036C2B42F
MAPQTPAPLRMIGRLLGAVACLAILVALVAGVPALFLKVGHQPGELTGGWHLLTQQDDGSLLLVVITLIGWAAWAAFTYSALLEIMARVRGRSVRRIRGLGGLQSLAGFLIGSIVLLAPTAASAATPAPAVAATAAHTAGAVSPSPAASTSTPTTDESNWPTHTVSSATEAPWDLAVTYLGDGQRWKDIAALNPEIPALAAGDGYLPQGAVITLPADARTTGTSAAATAPAPAPPATPHASAAEHRDEKTSEHSAPAPHTADAADHTVQDDENLSLIADKTYGDPAKWTVIFEANKGEEQPGGGHFTDPDLIYPGQHLTLPHASTPTTPPAVAKPASPPANTQQPAKPDTNPPDKAPDTPPTSHQAQPPSPSATTAPTTPSPAPTRTTAPTPNAATPAPRTPSDSLPAAPPQAPAEGESATAPSLMWMGAGAMAAALIGTLAVRRRLQQRRLRPGRRIPMPQGRAAATEQSLRAVQQPQGFELLDRALRSLALQLAAAGRELPVLEAVVLHEARVELHLDQDTAPIAPFTAAAGRRDLWTCSATSPDLADDEALKATDTPYPALVSLGWDGKGHLVLIDLEHVGTLRLTGDEDHSRHVLQAIAIELANTPLPGHLEVSALGQAAPGLEDAVPERVARTADLTAATTELAAHTGEQRRSLTALGATSPRNARLRDDDPGAWTPHIVLAEQLPQSPDSDRLFDLLAAEPRTAAAVITTGPADGPEGDWTLNCQGPDATVVLPGSQLLVSLQGLNDAHFTDAIEILTLAASEADVPAPDWVHADPDAAEDEEELEELGEDGLPTEYADLEADLSASEEPAHAAAAPAEAARPNLVKQPAHDHDQGEDEGEDEFGGGGLSLADVLAERDPDGSDRSATDADPAAHPAVSAASCVTPARGIRVTIPAPAATPQPLRIPAAETEVAAPASGPTVLVLGPIAVEGATGRIDSNRKRTNTELVAYLALHGGADHHAVDNALWPDSIVKKSMRDAVISRTRSWLGTDHFPRLTDTKDHRYRLGPHVTCDWTQFQRRSRRGLNDHTEDGDLALRQALTLVRGRPFTGIDPGRYAWAEPDVEEMVSAIAHAAYELSMRRREAGDIPGALWAARQGLLASEENEMLHRQIFLAHHATGDIDALRQAAATLAKINEQVGGSVDMDAETAVLLRNLLPKSPGR